MSLKFTPLAQIPAAVAACRAAYNREALLDLSKRRAVLRQVAKMLQEQEAAFLAATQSDLCKCAFETKVTELGMAKHEVFNALDNLEKWTAPRKVELEGIQHLDASYVKRDPLGVVLIIGAWNYPLQLTLVGMIGALAAGNTVVLKPSEVSPASAAALEVALRKYLPQEVVAVVQGGVAETTALLKERFDHILYTGNGRVARVVMAAAAAHLTPVTLELGGKSPCVVHRSADIKVTARRIMWGRLVNSGQTCIAPDYIMVQADVKAALVRELKAARDAFLGTDPKACKDYGRMVNDMHYERVVALMKGGRIVVGGEHDKATKFIAPTVLDDVDLGSPLMTDEIFGPLLPLVPYGEVEDAARFINARDKPLALYVFSSDSKVTDYLLQHTSSGAVTVNDTLMHAAIAGLPFGGVGGSGMGAYHGKHTFDTFTHPKSVLKKMLALEATNTLRYPPYTDSKYTTLMRVIGREREGHGLPLRIIAAVLVVCLATYVAYSRM